MSSKYNPITEQIEITGCKETEDVGKTNWTPLTTYVSGKIKDVDGVYDNKIDACTLPVDSERQTIDLGDLSELCN